MAKRKRTLKEIIEKLVGNEPIEAVFIEPRRLPDEKTTRAFLLRESPTNKLSTKIKGKVLSWKKGAKLLDYPTEYSYNGLVYLDADDCRDFYIWTRERIFFITYSANAGRIIVWIPRNPTGFNSRGIPVDQLPVWDPTDPYPL